MNTKFLSENFQKTQAWVLGKILFQKLNILLRTQRGIILMFFVSFHKISKHTSSASNIYH